MEYSDMLLMVQQAKVTSCRQRPLAGVWRSRRLSKQKEHKLKTLKSDGPPSSRIKDVEGREWSPGGPDVYHIKKGHFKISIFPSNV